MALVVPRAPCRCPAVPRRRWLGASWALGALALPRLGRRAIGEAAQHTAAVRRWLDRLIVGEDFCPWARGARDRGGLRVPRSQRGKAEWHGVEPWEGPWVVRGGGQLGHDGAGGAGRPERGSGEAAKK